MLVTRYHGVWSIVAAFSEAPVIADVIADLRADLDHVVRAWTTAVTTLALRR